MTEKIARRGVKTPDSYFPDLLQKITVKQVFNEEASILDAKSTIGEVRKWLKDLTVEQTANNFVIVDDEDNFLGIVTALDIYNPKYEEDFVLEKLISKKPMTIYEDNVLQVAVDIMAKGNVDLLPVVSRKNNKIILGVLGYKDILTAYRLDANELNKLKRSISLKRRGFKGIVHGKLLLDKRHRGGFEK